MAPPSGIGLETVLLFSEEGAKVVLVDINLQAAEKADELIHQRMPNAETLVLKADISVESRVKEIVEETVKRFGRLDIMFNNAGKTHEGKHCSQTIIFGAFLR